MDTIEKITNYIEKNNICYSLDDLLIGKLSNPNMLNNDPVKALKNLEYYATYNGASDLLNTYSITDFERIYNDYSNEITNILNIDPYVPCDLDVEDDPTYKLFVAINARLMLYYDIIKQ